MSFQLAEGACLDAVWSDHLRRLEHVMFQALPNRRLPERAREGRLESACKVDGCATGDMVTMRYDAQGHRVELVTQETVGGVTTTITTTFRYQGDAIAQELVGTGTPTVTRTYVTDEAGGVVKFCDPDCSGSNPQYLVTWNGHGDAASIWRINADATLTLANSFTYSTWGAPTTATHNSIADLGFRFLYVGRYGVAWDNAFGLGLEYMSARHYSPALGRFLQPDPSALEANLYGYADGNPVTNADPDGTRNWRIDGGRGGFYFTSQIRWAPRSAIIRTTNGRLTFQQGSQTHSSLMRVAKRPDPFDKGGQLSRVGRALEKHSESHRGVPQPYGKLTGNAAAKNAKGESVLESILRSRVKVVTTPFGPGRLSYVVDFVGTNGVTAKFLFILGEPWFFVGFKT